MKIRGNKVVGSLGICLLGSAFLLVIIAAGIAAEPQKKETPVVTTKQEIIFLGAGCFWCTEAVFEQIPGVHSVKAGYMGGQLKNPTYDDISTGKTGHAEVAEVAFDPARVSLEKIFEVFWQSHDPTTLNRQGADVGTQYRSAIFYSTPAQREAAEKSKKAAAAQFSDPIVTEITEAPVFYAAESYHQDYYRLNKNKNPYCRVVIAPKLRKLGLPE